ncbi:MAG: FimV/HubP family polar landmark protein, partial [Saezia sp.]
MNQGVQRKPAKSKAITSIALAVAMVAGGLSSVRAEALVLGQARVLSFIGEPLKAEIPITQLTKDEAASLMVSLASPSDFSSRGLIYTSTLSSMRVSYEVTGNNTAVIHIRSAKPMQDPFVDMLMDVRWRAGNVQRSYTMLIDPPPTMGMVSPNAIIPAGSEITPSGTVAPISVAATTSTQPATSFNTLPRTSAPTTATTSDGVVVRERVLGPGEGAGANRPSTPVQPTQPSASAPTSQTPAVLGSDLHVKVERGQTLGKVAAAFKPAGVTTEQMLAALYKANPSAFINNNINWVKSGATLRIPTDAEIAAISKTEARSLVGAHARQFNQRRAEIGQTPSSVVPTTSTDPRGGIVTPVTTTGVKPDSNSLVITAANDPKTGADQNLANSQQATANAGRDGELQGNRDTLGNIRDELNGNKPSGNEPGRLVETQQQRDAEAAAQQQRDAEAAAQQQRDAEAAAQQQRDAEAAAQQQRDAEA